MATAERLVAAHGVDGVSLRQIVLEAGSSNKSAVQYYFGSRDGLLDAIFAYRIADLRTRRTLLKARVTSDDLRGLVEAYALPLLELAEAPDCFYVTFVDQLERSGGGSRLLRTSTVRRARADFAGDITHLLDLPEPARSMRVEQAQAVCLHLAAERERALRRGDRVPAFGVFASGVVDGVTGFLAAPASDQTIRLATARLV